MSIIIPHTSGVSDPNGLASKLANLSTGSSALAQPGQLWEEYLTGLAKHRANVKRLVTQYESR